MRLKITTLSSVFFLCSLLTFSQQGALDPTFGEDGVAYKNGLISSALVLQPDGKIVTVGSGSGFEILRYTTDGLLDPTFGTNGIAVITWDYLEGEAWGVDLQNDGKIVICGRHLVIDPSNGQTRNQFATARLNADGSLDTSFGNNGRVLTDVTYSSFSK
ncbi:MAG: delta-60 repeat domain-containing protein, partial [Altibacter sp.]|nr:delta-60 repeat domain-containing protein [Altibacter sp.]